jgi:ABC-type uncharacterized transport system auxiliary subunit
MKNWRIKMKRLSILFIVLGLIMIQCGKRAMIRKYYLIEIPSDTTRVHADSLCFPVQVDVRDFQISKALDQTRIALRSDSHELNYYFYHHWAVRPSAGIPDMIYNVLSKKRCFSRLVRGFSSHPDYLITGFIYHLERDETDRVKAHLTADIKLVDAQSGITKVVHSFDRIEAYKHPDNMNAFAVTVSELLYQEIMIFTDKIVTYFNSPETDQS